MSGLYLTTSYYINSFFQHNVQFVFSSQQTIHRKCHKKRKKIIVTSIANQESPSNGHHQNNCIVFSYTAKVKS